MRRTILITCILILSLSCGSKQKSKNVDFDTTELAKTEFNTSAVNQNEEAKEAVNIHDVPLDTVFKEDTEPKEDDIYTFAGLKDEFKEAFDIFDLPIGTYFWDEFEDIETQYRLTENESKLLGQWMNVTFYLDLINNYYAFFPNKLFILVFNYKNIRIISSNNLYFDKALGTWEIINGIVQITIHAFIIQEASETYLPYSNDSKSVFFVERPYTVDFININDIGEEGFTRRPINDSILSNELRQMVLINEPNMTNNLYVRNVYRIDIITDSGQPEKNYGYFNIVREMAKENLSGFNIAANGALIEKYIFGLWP